jgi:REP element-mobilizing transposase RayT
MARFPRVTYPGAVFHVLNRFVDRHPFFQCDADYNRFLELFFEVAGQYRIATYAYCLMPNHFHFCIQTPTGEISAFLRRFLTRAAQTLNRRHLRTGHLFQGRSKTLIIETEAYFETVVAYVLLNSVRAGIVRDPLKYRWSSANEMLIENSPSPCRIDRWGLVEQISGAPVAPSATGAQIEYLRRWLRAVVAAENEKKFRDGHLGLTLGDDRFRRRVMLLTERRKRFEETRTRRAEDRPPENWSWSDCAAVAARAARSIGPGETSAWAGTPWLKRDLKVFLAHACARWTYDRIQREDGDRHRADYYATIVARLRHNPRKRAVVERIGVIPQGTFLTQP